VFALRVLTTARARTRDRLVLYEYVYSLPTLLEQSTKRLFAIITMGGGISKTRTGGSKQEERGDHSQQQPDDRSNGLATTVRVEIEHASAATVWQVVTDIEHKADFVPWVESTTMLGDREFKVGLQWKERRDNGRRRGPMVEQHRTVVRLEDKGEDGFPKSFSESITNRKNSPIATTKTWTVYPTAADHTENDENWKSAGCILLLSLALLSDPPSAYCCCAKNSLSPQLLDFLETYCTQELHNLAAEAERREVAAAAAAIQDRWC